MEKYKYCPICKKELIEKELEGRIRITCPDCVRIFYRNPLPATAALAVNEQGEILMIKRAVEPFKGQWCLPGGFVEMGESLAESVVRELSEETGLSGKAGRFVGAHIQKSEMYGGVLVVGIEVITKDGTLTPGDDAEEAKFVPIDKIPDIPFETHRKLIEEYMLSRD